MRAKISLDASDARRIAEPIAEALCPAVEKVVRAVLAEAVGIGFGKPSVRVLGREEVARKFGVSERSLDRLEEEGHIPRRRQVSPRRVGWLEHECDAALLKKPLAVGGAPPPGNHSNRPGRPGPSRRIGRDRSARSRSYPND